MHAIHMKIRHFINDLIYLNLHQLFKFQIIIKMFY